MRAIIEHELTQEVDRALRALTIAHECEFGELEARLADDLAAVRWVLLMIMLAADGAIRAQCAALMRRIDDRLAERYPTPAAQPNCAEKGN